MKVLLFTGGLDSTALAFRERPDLVLTINYGQLAAGGEVRAATAIAQELSLTHEVLALDLRSLGTGALVGQQALSDDMPPEWWPYRNQLLVTLAAMKIAPFGGGEILIGTVKGDDAHCDGKPEFVESLDKTLRVQRPPIRLRAPGLMMTPDELIKWSGVPRELLGWTFSCHSAAVPCGACRGCGKHIETLRRAFS